MKNQILDLIDSWYETVFAQLSETKVEQLFSEFECSDFQLHKAYFVSPSGKIFMDNAKGMEHSHGHMMASAISKANKLNPQQEIYNKLSHEEMDKFWDITFNKYQDRLIYELNWVKLNTGTMLDSNNPYIVLPDRTISYSQHSKIIDFLYTLDQPKVIVNGSVDTTISNLSAKYDLSEYSVEDIMNRIDTYYRTGILLEKNYSNDSLQDLWEKLWK